MCNILEARQIHGKFDLQPNEFRTKRFQLLEEHLIEFNQLAIKNSGGDEDILNRVMTKDNIALAAVFKTIVPSNGKSNQELRNH